MGGEACSALATEWRPWQALGPSRGDRSRRAYRPYETFVAPPLRTAAIGPFARLQNLPCERAGSARTRSLAERWVGPTNRSGTHPFEPKRAFPFGPRTFGGGPLGSVECPPTTPAPAPAPFASPDKRHPLRGSKASSRAPATNRDRISNGVATKSATVSGRPSRACRQSRHSGRSESGAADNQTWRCTV